MGSCWGLLADSDEEVGDGTAEAGKLGKVFDDGILGAPAVARHPGGGSPRAALRIDDPYQAAFRPPDIPRPSC